MDSNRARGGRERRGRAAGVWVPVVLFALLAWPVILSGFVRGRGAFDQLNYHEQAVRRFAEQLPSPDYSNYLSATTPGYHTALALVARYVDDQRWVLQLAGSAFTLALVGLLAWAVGRARAERGSGSPVAGSVALVLPFMLSMSVFHSGVWMLPDNAGWLGVLGVWLIALRPRFDRVTVLAGGAALAALIFVRQIHLWPWAMLMTGAWLGRPEGADGGFELGQEYRALTSGPAPRAGRAALAVLAGVPAVLVLVWFWKLWGGSLTPPVFNERHVGLNPSAPSFVLAVFGLFSLPFLPFVADGVRRLWVRETWLLGLALCVALGLALAAPTTRSYLAGRYSGLWEIARHLPAPGGRSVVIVPLAVLGGGLLAAWFLSLGRRDRWVMLAALVAFTAAQCASHKLWQRYTEPMVLMWLVLAASRVAPARSAAGEGWRVVGPALLGGTLAVVTAASLVFGKPVYPRALLFPGETEAPVLPGMVGGVREGWNQGDPAPGEDRSGEDAPGWRSEPEH